MVYAKWKLIICLFPSPGLAEKTQLLKLNVPATFMLVALDEGPGPPIKYQYAELGKLYTVVSQLVRCCDVSSRMQSSINGSCFYSSATQNIMWTELIWANNNGMVWGGESSSPMRIFILAQDLVTDKPATLSVCCVGRAWSWGLSKMKDKGTVWKKNIYIYMTVITTFISD